MYHYTYQITNLINNKKYYGVRSSKCLPEEDTKYWGSGTIIKRAVKKYGIENFSKGIDKLFETRDKANLYEAEIVNEEWVEDKNTYNLGLGGCGGKIYIGENPFYGKKHTKQSIQKMSEAAKGRKVSEETRRKRSEAQKGKTINEETRRKISETKKGKKGKTPSEESRNKMSISSSKNWLVISPDGEEYNIRNLHKFCKENNLHTGNMHSVSVGRLKQCKGWTCKKID